MNKKQLLPAAIPGLTAAVAQANAVPDYPKAREKCAGVAKTTPQRLSPVVAVFRCGS